MKGKVMNDLDTFLEKVDQDLREQADTCDVEAARLSKNIHSYGTNAERVEKLIKRLYWQADLIDSIRRTTMFRLKEWAKERNNNDSCVQEKECTLE